jgi:hypothetical protein
LAIASRVIMTPTCDPSAPITRTRGTLIWWFLRSSFSKLMCRLLFKPVRQAPLIQ